MTVYSIMPNAAVRNMTATTAAENWALCAGCTECCSYLSLEIERPTTLRAIDQIVWYLVHQNVWVWVDEEGKWYVQFNTPCEKLEADGSCGWYAQRPKLCQDYKQADCPRYTAGTAEKFLFKDENQFLQWLAHARSAKLRNLHQRYLMQRAQRWQRTKQRAKERKT